MAKLLNPIFNLIKFHKLKMLTVIVFTLVFGVLMFPKQDLSDWVSGLIIKNTGIYMRFDNLGPAFVPTPGISAENVVVEPNGLPPIQVGEVAAAPLYGKILTAKAGVKTEATSIFGGDVNLRYAQGGENMHEINMEASRLNLEQLATFLRGANMLSLKLQGLLDLTSDLKVDQTFAAQPSGVTTVQIPDFTFPSQEITVNFNGAPLPLPLPSVRLGQVNVTTTLGDGQLEINNINIGGKPNNDVAGKIKGTVGMNFQQMMGAVRPQVNKVDLRVDVTLEKNFVARTPVINTVLSLISNPTCKQVTDRGTRIACHVVISPGQMFPDFLPLTEKL